MRIHHLALRSRDLPRLERFYVEILGLERSHSPARRPESVWLRVGEEAILMLEPATDAEPPVPSGSLDLVAFACEDTETYRARLQRAGVTIEAETAHTLYFRDPDGRRVAVSRHPLR